MKHSTLERLHTVWGIYVPHFFLFEWSLWGLEQLRTPKIILRSSYIAEDSKEKSYAWVFQSRVVDKNTTENIIKNIEEIQQDASAKLGGNTEWFHIMVQEYYEIIGWGVAFYEDDKIYIELSRQGSKWVVAGEVDGTLYQQYHLSIETGEYQLTKPEKKKLLRVLNKIKKSETFSLDVEFGILPDWNIIIFQVRPITKSVFGRHILAESSNISENYPGQTSTLTYSFTKKLYSDVYRTTAYESWLSYEKITELSHIFDGLIIRHEGALKYNIINWYKMLLLFPWNHKKAFDTMIGSSGSIKYIELDELKWKLPNFFFIIKYLFRVLVKIFTFQRNLRNLEQYLEIFYRDFATRKLKDITTEGLFHLLTRFMEELSRRWYVTIDNDFLIMKFMKEEGLSKMHGLYSTNQLYNLKMLANNEITLEQYCEKYGDRIGDELKLENPPFQYSGSEFQKIVHRYKDIELPHREKPKSTFLAFLIANRERFRIFRAKNFSVARTILLEIAQRLHEAKILEKKEDIFDLHLEEISAYIENQASILLRNQAKELIGAPFEGKIYIMHDFHIPTVPYDIIVAKNFDPGWTLFLGWLKGIIIENGNLLSHISIMARELSLPLLLWAKWATEILQTGQLIRVWKDGTIYVWNNDHYEPLS